MWKTYCSKQRVDLSMKLSITRSGLKVKKFKFLFKFFDIFSLPNDWKLFFSSDIKSVENLNPYCYQIFYK